MHIPNHTISVPVAASLAAVTLVLVSGAIRRLRREGISLSPATVGTIAALVFVLQMVNVALPGTAASGHLVGAALAVALLGDTIGFLTMVAVITVQALVFADGGLLAVGGNCVTMAVVPCLVVSPLIRNCFPTLNRGFAAALVGGLTPIVGSMGVVAIVWLSRGVSSSFIHDMLMMHTLVGAFELLVTGGLVLLISNRFSLVKGGLVLGLAIMATTIASTRPDALEWSLSRQFGQEVSIGSGAQFFEMLQSAIALAPDYQLPLGGMMLPALLGALLVGGLVSLLVARIRGSRL